MRDRHLLPLFIQENQFRYVSAFENRPLNADRRSHRPSLRAMAYVYTPLQSGDREIRVLDVKPWKVGVDDALELCLETVSLDAPGDYDALSYTWGKPNPKYDVKMDGFDFQVGGNLHAALRHLRLQDQSRRLWVDAVCINQVDVQERQAQVSIMGGIYRSASSVVAWIGEHDGHGDERAFQLINQIFRQLHSTAAIDKFMAADVVPSMEEFTFQIHKNNLDWIKSVTPLGFVNSPWLNLSNLLERPWFGRIWIIQEVVMGRSVMLHCGMRTVDWGDL